MGKQGSNGLKLKLIKKNQKTEPQMVDQEDEIRHDFKSQLTLML